jgi:5-methylcytosine-specific restriction enzyme A
MCMLKKLYHIINLTRNSLRDVGVPEKRSGKWPTVEKHFREAHPTCAACGGTKNLNVHHIHPFHKFPELELDPNNLITMCMGEKECHLKIAHGSNFKTYCPDVRKYVEQIRKKEKTFEEIYEIAKKEAKKN